jgi:tetratricopeptide (TPR) repeat protein
MRYILIVIFLFVTVGLYSQTVEQLIAQGDVHATKEFNNQAALEKYQKAEKLAPGNWEVLWRISRCYIDIGEHLPTGTDAQKQAQLAKYQDALNYANKAIKAGPDKTVNYLRRAIANGRIALFRGIFTAIGLVNEVREDLEKAIKLGNGGTEIQSICHYVLGRTHFKVCEKPYLVRLPLGLGWGDMDISLQEFAKSIEMRPAYRMFRIDYARALVEEKEYAKAKEQLNKIPTIAIADEDDEQFASEAKALLDKIRNK